ncbi:MAG: hypothetical protein ACOYS2_03440 [Patescibacteria group bacterium]
MFDWLKKLFGGNTEDPMLMNTEAPETPKDPEMPETPLENPASEAPENTPSENTPEEMTFGNGE